jgi:hypothetical protein
MIKPFDPFMSTFWASCRKRKVSLFLFFWMGLGAGTMAQGIHWGIVGGVHVGGPLPTELTEGSSGKPGFAPHFGLEAGVSVGERGDMKLGLFYVPKPVSYQATFTRDTLYSFSVNGSWNTVPTYYTAMVTGKMNTGYLEARWMYAYRTGKRLRVTTGVYLSRLVFGGDKGNVRVIIGEGGFFEDYREAFDHTSLIRHTDGGILLGISFPFSTNLSASLISSRSLFPLYTADPSDKDESDPILFQTQFYLSFSWLLRPKGEKNQAGSASW